jgi:serine/threonine protein kinase
MSYLTSRNIVHGDLATRNILLSGDIEDEQNPSTSNIIAQVSDFGLAQILQKNELSQRTTYALPFRWVAIECLEFLKKTKTPNFSKTPTLNEKTDIWSYGVTLWEMFTYGRTPYDVLLDENEGLPLNTTYSEFSSELNNLINGPGKISHTESATKTKEYTQNFDDIIFLLNFLKNDGGRLEKPPICNGELWNIITIDCKFAYKSCTTNIF